MIIEADRITAGYGSVPVLENLSFSAHKGEFVAILGPNGSGKSTLLRALAGLLPARSGQILLNGESIRRLPPAKRAKLLAYLPQDPVIPARITVEELVRLGRFPHGHPFSALSRADREAADAALVRTGMAPFRKRLLGSLSGGECRRARIAMTLAQEPQFLLLDEPAAFLDPAVSLEISNLLRDLVNRNGLTLIVVLHDFNLAARFASRLVFLRHGQILKDGTPRETITPETFRDVFDLDVAIFQAPDGSPFCIPQGKSQVR